MQNQMGDRGQEIRQKIEAARDTLEAAEFGLTDLDSDDPRRRLAGFRNLVVFGRAVTNALQTLRTPLGQDFDDWYLAKEREMRDDELLRYFYVLRSEILKEGRIGSLAVRTVVASSGPSDMARLQQQAPPGAQGFFMGDRLGGDGWDVKLPDGSREKYYISLPEDIEAETTVHLTDPPALHLGQEVKDTTIKALGTHYVGYLQDLLTEAEARFD